MTIIEVKLFGRRQNMQTIGITEFKAHALKIIDRVAKSKEKIIITKRGKPVAEVGPFKNPVEKHAPGKLAGMLLFEKDIVAPLGEEMWEACK